MTTYGMSDATDRIKRNSARGLSFWKMVGIHLSSVPEEQAFIEAARKEHKDLHVLNIVSRRYVSSVLLSDRE